MSLGEKVGGVYYDVSLDTGKLLVEVRVINQQMDKLAEKGDRAQFSLNAIAKAAAAVGTAMAAIRMAQRADEFQLLAARVNIAAGSVEAGTVAFASLVAMSRRTQTSLAGNIEVFQRLNQSMLQMGGTQRDTLALTELMAKAIKVSGASATEAKAAMLQFGQAMGSGRLQGDELRSLMENAPYLMRQMAAGIGVPVGELRKLGEQGKLTADVVANALSKSAAQIDRDFAQMPKTISDAMQVAEDSAALAALKFRELTGNGAQLIGSIKGTGEALDALADQFAGAKDHATGFGQNQAVRDWANQTRVALSYVIDAADFTWQTLSVLGRNVAFVFKGLGTEIGGIAAQIVAVARGDFAGAAAIGDAMKEDADKRRSELDAADAKTLSRTKLFGQAMREAWDQGAGAGRGSINPEPARSKLKTKPDEDELRKLRAKAAAAQAYYQGLVADNATAMAKIDAEEKKALADNSKRAAEDKNNQKVYAAARFEIVKHYAKERALLEEHYAQEVGDHLIATTTDAEAKIEATRFEGIRRAAAAEKLGTMTHDEAERAKTLATYNAAQARAALAEKLAQTQADNVIAATVDEMTRIDLVRQETMRRADAAYKAGAITFAQAEADKVRASVDAQNAIRSQLLSINPLAQLQREYEAKLALVQQYETRIAQSGIDATGFAEAKRTELSRQYQAQRMQIAEAEFAWQSEGNKFLIDSLNALSTSATQSITGLLTGTMSAADAMRNLASVVLNEAVGALVQIGVQYLKNAIIGQAADKALLATKAANAALYTSAIAAQVGVNTSLAAQGAFAATAAIPIIGPGLAPAAAAAAGAAAAALGAPAVAAAPIAGARRYGGPVSAGSLYKINEGGRPEMFTGTNGAQYMLPTRSGNVTPADEIGSGVGRRSSEKSGGGGASTGGQIVIYGSPDDTVKVRDLARLLRSMKRDFLITKGDLR